MSIKDFNAEYTLILKEDSFHGEENNIKLNCMLMRTISNFVPEELYANALDTSLFWSNVYDLLKNANERDDSKNVWACIEFLNKCVVNGEIKEFVLEKLRFMPLIVDILESTRATNKIDQLLNILQKMTEKIVIKTIEPFSEKLIVELTKLITNDSANKKLRKKALSVLINVCQNAKARNVLQGEIHLVEFQKRIPVEDYGILSCKMNLILNDIGHLLTDVDIKNLLKFAANEIVKCVKTQDTISLKQIDDFIKYMSSRENIRHMLVEYDFYATVESVLMFINKLESTDLTTECVSIMLSLLSRIIKSKNETLKDLRITILNFAIDNMKISECCPKSLEAINCVLTSEPTINTTHFEMTDLRNILSTLLSDTNYKPNIIIPLLKLLLTLKMKYEFDLLDSDLINSILAPIITGKELNFNDIPSEHLTMYLQCLLVSLKLSESKQITYTDSLLKQKNIQYMVAMSVKNGNQNQCQRALELIRACNIPIEYIAETIVEAYTVDNDKILINSSMTNLNGYTKKPSDDKIEKTILKITKAIDDGQINTVPTCDFFKIYDYELNALNQKVELQARNLEELSKQLTLEKQNASVWKIALHKSMDVAKELQHSNEILLKTKKDLETNLSRITISLDSFRKKYDDSEKKHQLTKVVQQKEKQEYENLQKKYATSTKTVQELQDALKEKIKRVEALESELKEQEEMQSTIFSIMQSKRKK